MQAVDPLALIGPDRYAAAGYPHELWARLRREAPLCRVDAVNPHTPGFWAVTRHADVVSIAKRPALYRNAPRLAVLPDFAAVGGELPLRHLLNMDPPEHAAMRGLASRHFTPRALRTREARVLAIAREVVSRLADGGREGACDFVEAVASVLPLAVIADVLGVPRSDWPLLFAWTNATIGSTDPEYQRPGESAAETAARARVESFQYFLALIEERRRAPRDDLTSALAAARCGGAPLPPRELLSYLFLVVVAGNETTRNATSGGLLALIEHPDELRRLRADPGLLGRAVEEIVRWTSPVIQFTRTAAADTELSGQRIRAGESLCLFYPSANRDEAVFSDADVFRIARSPNPHLAFGIGEHFCLGAHVARLELRVVFGLMLEAFEEVELAGPPSRLRSSFVGGIKHMPIRYRLRDRAVGLSS